MGLASEWSQPGLVPYTPCPVVRDALLAFCFHFLDCVVEEEVEQDGVYLRVGMLPQDLPAYQFYAPYAAGCDNVND